MKVATWNVNSVRARLERLTRWLRSEQPDFACLQELKVSEDRFPHLELKELGYHCAVHAQKSYNGVAILSRASPKEVKLGFDDGVDDPQARIVCAKFDELDVMSLYVPNGSHVDAPAFEYKLAWLARLRRFLTRRFSPSARLLVCGDFNIAPDTRDVARPEQWDHSVLCAPQVRDEFAQLQRWGLVDTLRKHHAEPGLFSWWDYRMLGFAKNNGLRIDHILATPPAAQHCSKAWIDRDQRKGKRPSDHAPVWAEFDL
ncbi:MAG: exodeoxyribonuclease III [Proteobacteria bacterium]|nr:exodeoxyribonuclease III [Pseudomonadota bacterium]